MPYRARGHNLVNMYAQSWQDEVRQYYRVLLLLLVTRRNSSIGGRVVITLGCMWLADRWGTCRPLFFSGMSWQILFLNIAFFLQHNDIFSAISQSTRKTMSAV